MKKTIALVLALLMTGAGVCSCRKNRENDLLTLKYNYDLSEYIDLADYKGLPANGYEVVVTDEDVANQALMSRAYYSRLNDVTDRGAEMGDTVYIDYTATFKSEDIEPYGESDVELTLGTSSMFAAFEEALVGVMPETDLSLDLTFPETYYNEPAYAGEEVHFDVHVHEVCEQELPEYTDDFVRAYLGYDSIADYEAAARQALTEHYQEIYYKYIAAQIWDAVVENTTVKQYPEKELNDFCTQRTEFDKAYAELLGLNFESYLDAFYGITEDEYDTQLRTEGEAKIKEEMIYFAIARLENITLTEEEYQKLALEYAKNEELASVEALEAIYDKDTIRTVLMEDKVVRRVVDLADVTIQG